MSAGVLGRMKRLMHKVVDARRRHIERHRPSGFGFAIADSIAYLSSADWNQITDAASIFLRRPYLAALEHAGPENLQHRYAIIYRSREPVACMAAQLVRLTGSHLVGTGSKRTADARSNVVRRAVGAAKRRL